MSSTDGGEACGVLIVLPMQLLEALFDLIFWLLRCSFGPRGDIYLRQTDQDNVDEKNQSCRPLCIVLKS